MTDNAQSPIIDEKIAALIEGAYIQTPTHPGYWVKYEDIRNKFNELISLTDSSELQDFDSLFDIVFPTAKSEDNYQPKESEEVFKAVRVTPNKLNRLVKLKKMIDCSFDKARIWKDEWKPFAAMGSPELKELCQSLGFSGIRNAIECIFKNRYIFKIGDASKHEPPLLIVRVKLDEDSVVVEKKNIQSTKANNQIIKQGSYIGTSLNKFAYFPKTQDSLGWDAAINTLATAIALEERWYYHDNESEKRNKPILKNYLSYTFERLQYEDEQEKERAINENRQPRYKIITNENNALFNTGLVNNLYEPIYAIFKRNNGKNPIVKQPWIFVSFATANSRYQSIITDFPYRPVRAEYFTDPADLLYDINAEKPTINWEHIICENVARLPLGFVKKGAPDGYPFNESITQTDRTCQDQYYSKLAKDISEDEDWMQFLTTRFKNSLEIALSRVAWNYKTAIPVYYEREHKLSLLLPLALEKKGVIDVALVCEHKVNKEKGINNYLGRTIFTLQMAYNNARLITRPDSDWLMADMCE